MKNKNLNRKEFIIKSGKCLGSLSCMGIASTIIQSCNKPNPISNSDPETLFLTTCDDHEATFNQNGTNIDLPYTGWENISSLNKYNSEIIYNDEGLEESILITKDDDNITLFFSEYPNLINIDGISSTNANNIDSYGLLLYRKNQTEVIVFSRRCPHAGGMLSNFL